MLGGCSSPLSPYLDTPLLVKDQLAAQLASTSAPSTNSNAASLNEEIKMIRELLQSSLNSIDTSLQASLNSIGTSIEASLNTTGSLIEASLDSIGSSVETSLNSIGTSLDRLVEGEG